MAPVTAAPVLQWEVIQEGRRVKRFIIRRLWITVFGVVTVPLQDRSTKITEVLRLRRPTN